MRLGRIALPLVTLAAGAGAGWAATDALNVDVIAAPSTKVLTLKERDKQLCDSAKQTAGPRIRALRIEALC